MARAREGGKWGSNEERVAKTTAKRLRKGDKDKGMLPERISTFVIQRDATLD